MKKITKIFLIAIFLSLSIGLMACTTSIEATGSLEILQVTRTSVEFEVKITDKAKKDSAKITATSIQVQVYQKDDNKLQKTGSAFSDSTDETIGSVEATDKVNINDLKANTEYYAKLVCTIKSNLVTLSEIDFKTNNSGDSADNPIKISTKSDLNKIKNDLTAYYVLEKDLDFSSGDEKGEFTPLFTNSSSSKFTGVFDGQGHTIKNFKITESKAYYGFFGYVSEGAVIKNLKFDNISIDSSRYSDTTAGIVCGTLNRNAVLENIEVTNSTIKITTSTSQQSSMKIGGLVGQNDGGKIVNCSVTNTTLDITAAQYLYVGGFVGENSNTSDTETGDRIESSYAVVDIKVRLKNERTSFSDKNELLLIVGGFVGNNLRAGYIKDCYSQGSIKASFSMDIDKDYMKEETSEETSTFDSESTEVKPFDEVINTNYSVEIGGFVGMNAGYINNIATSNSIDFTSYDAYHVDLGLICGVLFSSGSLKNAVSIGNKQQLRVILLKSDIKDGTDITNTSSEGVVSQDEPDLDKFKREIRVDVIGRNSAQDTKVLTYITTPTLELSTKLENVSFTGTSNDYTTFSLSDTLKNVIKNWLEA